MRRRTAMTRSAARRRPAIKEQGSEPGRRLGQGVRARGWGGGGRRPSWPFASGSRLAPPGRPAGEEADQGPIGSSAVEISKPGHARPRRTSGGSRVRALRAASGVGGADPRRARRRRSAACPRSASSRSIRPASGSASSRGSTRRRAMTSCRRATRAARRRPARRSRKSLRTTTRARRVDRPSRPRPDRQAPSAARSAGVATRARTSRARCRAPAAGGELGLDPVADQGQARRGRRSGSPPSPAAPPPARRGRPWSAPRGRTGGWPRRRRSARASAPAPRRTGGRRACPAAP